MLGDGAPVELTWKWLLAFAGASGVAAAAVTQAFSWARDSRQRKFDGAEAEAARQRVADAQEAERAHQFKLQQAEQEHLRAMRREEAHYKARDVYLPDAQAIHDWVQGEWADRYGHEHDYVRLHVVASTLQRPEEVVKAARHIATGHPTRRVREIAYKIEVSVDDRFNVVDGNSVGEPSEDDFRTWSTLVRDLLDAIHDVA
jgi:hypothetical protein